MINTGKIIWRIRYNTKLSQTRFAKSIGFSRSYIAQIELNKTKPSFEFIQALSIKYNINPNIFFIVDAPVYINQNSIQLETDFNNESPNNKNYRESLTRLFFNYLEHSANAGKMQLTSNDVRNIKELLNNL